MEERGVELVSSYITPKECELHHQVMEVQLELLRAKDRELEERINNIATRLSNIEGKIDLVLKSQTDLNKYLIWLLVGIVLTLIGVVLGRVVDFGYFV